LLPDLEDYGDDGFVEDETKKKLLKDAEKNLDGIIFVSTLIESYHFDMPH